MNQYYLKNAKEGKSDISRVATWRNSNIATPVHHVVIRNVWYENLYLSQKHTRQTTLRVDRSIKRSYRRRGNEIQLSRERGDRERWRARREARGRRSTRSLARYQWPRWRVIKIRSYQRECTRDTESWNGIYSVPLKSGPLLAVHTVQSGGTDRCLDFCLSVWGRRLGRLFTFAVKRLKRQASVKDWEKIGWKDGGSIGDCFCKTRDLEKWNFRIFSFLPYYLIYYYCFYICVYQIWIGKLKRSWLKEKSFSQ